MLNSKNRTVLLIFGILFMVISTLLVVLFLNTQLISEYDKYWWNTKITLIISGVCFGGFFITLKFLNFLSITKLFLIFLIVRIVILYFFITLNYSVEMDFALATPWVHKVLNGDLFTPYFPIDFWISDTWRMVPPMFMWWYTYNYLIYGLNTVLWRVVNLLLEVGIVYVITQMFRENSATEKGWKDENFKIGLSLYIFSVIPINCILLSANIIAFPVLLGILGFLFFFRSKKNPKYLYHAVFFFCLAALTEYFAAIWILGILLIELFRKNFRRLFILIGEIVAVFCLVTLPFLINDAMGFLQRLVWQFKVYSINLDGTIWAFNYRIFGWPEIISYIPTSIALSLSIYYIYKNYKSGISLDLFIVIICIFLFFTPGFGPGHFLWILPLLCLNIIYSFRKFFIANLFFLGYFLYIILWWVTAYLTYPGLIYPDIFSTYTAILNFYATPSGFLVAFRLTGQIIFQMGFIYLIFSYTKSKKLVLGLLIPFIIYYIVNICMPANLIFNPH